MSLRKYLNLLFMLMLVVAVACGGALVLSRQVRPGAQRLRGTLVDAEVPAPSGALAGLAGGNAMAPMLPLFEALARGDHLALLHAGPGRGLRRELSHA